MNFNKINLNLISFFITTIIFSIIITIIFFIFKPKIDLICNQSNLNTVNNTVQREANQSKMNQNETNQNETNQNETNQNETNQNETNQSEANQNEIDQAELIQSEKMQYKSNANEIIAEETNTNLSKEKILEIPSLNLKAKVMEGTDENILSNYIGQYTEYDNSSEGNNKENKDNVKLAFLSYNYGDKRKKYFTNLKELEYGDKIIYNDGQTEKTYIVETNKLVHNDLETIKSSDKKSILLFTYVIDMPDAMRCVIANPI